MFKFRRTIEEEKKFQEQEKKHKEAEKCNLCKMYGTALFSDSGEKGDFWCEYHYEKKPQHCNYVINNAFYNLPNAIKGYKNEGQ